MDDTAARPDLKRPLLTFTLVLIGGQALLILLESLFPGLKIPDSLNLIVTIAGAIIAGRGFAQRHLRAPDKRECLRFGLAATAVSALLALVTLWILFRIYDLPLTMENLALGLGGGDSSLTGFLRDWLWAILAFGLLLTFGLTAAGLSSGARGWLKRQAKAAR